MSYSKIDNFLDLVDCLDDLLDDQVISKLEFKFSRSIYESTPSWANDPFYMDVLFNLETNFNVNSIHYYSSPKRSYVFSFDIIQLENFLNPYIKSIISLCEFESFEILMDRRYDIKDVSNRIRDYSGVDFDRVAEVVNPNKDIDGLLYRFENIIL